MKDHHLWGISINGELIIDDSLCAFYPGCWVWDKNNPFQIDISTKKRVIGKYNSHDFIINYSYSNFKDHHLIGMISLGEPDISNFKCALDLYCEQLNKNKPFPNY